ncbi:MAG: protein-disulfide reductase DsbD domain-containing protein [Blastocatellia bacterium]
MRSILIRTVFSLVLILAAGALTESLAQTVSGSIGNGIVSRGSAAKGSVVLIIPGGLHVNSNRPNSQYAIPTTVRVSGTGVRLSGVTFPRGKNRKFQFSDSVINVYEGTVRFPFTVNVPANFKGNVVRVRAVIRYQACTDEVCYPPKNKEVTLTARIR